MQCFDNFLIHVLGLVKVAAATTNSWFGIQYILCTKIKMNALIQQQSKSDLTILLDTNHNFSPSIYIQKPADESIIR